MGAERPQLHPSKGGQQMNNPQKSTKRQLRAALYLKAPMVHGTGTDSSIKDLRRQLEDYCWKRGWAVVDEYVEKRGVAGGNRSQFKKLLEDAKRGDCRVDKVVVNSFCSIPRDPTAARLAIEQLRARGIEIVNITQAISDEEMRVTVDELRMLLGEAESRQRSENVTRLLRKDASEGFWCGGPAPYGFRTFVAEMRGSTAKKKIAVEPLEADVIRKMFDLLENGDVQSRPMGVKSITDWLNENGHRARHGKNWTIGKVQRLLTNTAIKGDYLYGKKAGSEAVIHIPFPAIIPAHRFDAAQKVLRSLQRSRKSQEQPSGIPANRDQ